MLKEQEPGIRTNRRTEYAVHPMFVNRWSPRAMSGEEISLEDLMELFEAARWAPSSYNNQPWRFVFARRNTPAWEPMFNLLIEKNQSWAKNAAVLIVIVSKEIFENGNPSLTHCFDAGAAWMSLALQGSLNGFVVHGMEGFDYERAKGVLHIPEEYQIQAMAAVGRPGRKEDLPEALQAREFPSDRKKLSETVFEGIFSKA